MRQQGSWRPDLVGGVCTDADLRECGLPGLDALTQRISADGAGVAFWRATVSSWVLGIALRQEGENYTERFYSSASEPGGCTSDAPDGWTWTEASLPIGDERLKRTLMPEFDRKVPPDADCSSVAPARLAMPP